jgi:hypothetical protein
LYYKAKIGKRKNAGFKIRRPGASQPSCRLALWIHRAEDFRVMPPPRKVSARQRVLAQWRGVDLSPLETAKAVRARDAGKIVSKVLSDLKMDSRRADIEIVKVWNLLIDPNITAHAQPTGLNKKGTLFVSVDNDTQKYDIILYHAAEILKRMQYSFGLDKIKKISFRVG